MSTKKNNCIPADELLMAYAQGIFPMASDKKDDEVQWYTAIHRGIIPMETFKVSSNVARIIKKAPVQVSINKAFEKVMKQCANRETSWISKRIIKSYVQLHELGFAHSVEIWKDEKLVGGLYGVQLGKAFFGESMFKTEKEMDKVALFYAHQWLKSWECELWDTQFWTEHLSQFGCIEIDAESYKNRLEIALRDVLE